MIGFSQSNDLLGMFPTTLKDRSMNEWPDQMASTNVFCDEIDEIMKHEHEDVILLGDSLTTTTLDFDLDSISDLLENNPVSSATPSSFAQPMNIHELSPTSTSGYSSSDISPKFLTLSINNNRFQPYAPTNNLHLLSYVPPQQQQENALLGTSYPFELQNHVNGPPDVKRFRSASMNDGSMSFQQNRLVPFTRPVSNSFSEVETHETQLRSNPTLLSSSGNGTPNIRYSGQKRPSNDFSIQSQTLFSINQSSNEDVASLNRKRHSLVDLPLTEIKVDPESPNCTMEPQSEPDLWSDIEQNSSDHVQDDETTSDDETAVSSSARKSSDPNLSSSSLFWLYNVQSKGPKTKRILYLKERDPHLHREFSDPVYQIKLSQIKGHGCNKLRKGDGNDVTPNPMKLYQLGKQIHDLSQNSASVYHGIYHVDHHSNSNDTVEVKKEKNKIASRACRLRKKAQHEANKLKLHGLNNEHKSINDIITSMKLLIIKRYRAGQLNSPSSSPHQSLEAALDQLINKKYCQPVAGNSDAFVQSIVGEMEKLHAIKDKRANSLNS